MSADTLGTKIRVERLLRGWEQEELASRMHTSVPTISRIENDIRGLYVHELVKLSSIFQVSITTLVEAPVKVDLSSEESEALLGLMRVARFFPLPVLRCVIALAEALLPYLGVPEAPVASPSAVLVGDDTHHNGA